MLSKFVLTYVALFCVVSMGQESPICLTTIQDTRLCSTLEISDGETITELLQSILSMNVDRKGLEQVTANKFDDPVPPAEGSLSPNGKLEENVELVFPFLTGPESLFKVDDSLYAAAANAIYRVDLRSGNHTIVYDGNKNCSPERPCSRPLGIRIKGNRLLCADALQGLIEVDLSSGDSKVHLAAGSLIDDKPLLFPDDIDVDWEKEIVYMSDGSTKWSLDYCFLAVIESDPSSRVIRFEMKTGKTEVFAQNLRFANGIQISHDKKFLLVDEFSARRILKYPLDGPLPASGEPFTGLLPGNPDNIRPSLTGGYWVALPIARRDGSRNLLDELQARPDLSEKFGNSALTVGGLAASLGTLLQDRKLRDLGHKVSTGQFILDALPKHGYIVELDAEGNLLQTLQSTENGFLTEVLEHEDGLYCGSFTNKFIVSLPKSNFREP